MENVTPDGQELPDSALGRHQNPGHAIEGAWFIMDWVRKNDGDRQVVKEAIDKFLMNPFNAGWDDEHGGLLYFQDVDGRALLSRGSRN